MPQHYLASLALDVGDTRQSRTGYMRALRLLDTLKADVVDNIPEAREVRATRTTVDFILKGPSADVVRQRLGLLRDDLTTKMAARWPGMQSGITIAAVRCRHGLTSEPLMRQAEALLGHARREQGRILVAAGAQTGFDEDWLMADLRRAIDQDELTLHYQPKLRARHGEIAGVEALLRWTHPRHGAISPDLFVRTAERSGDIRAVTDWVMGRAIADRAILAEAGLTAPTYVNVSAPLIAQPHFAADLLRQLSSHVDQLGIEITETEKIAEPEQTLVRLHEFADAGIRLSIDDYGSGFSSLAYLRRLPVHELKIDRAFISQLSINARDPLLVRSTIDLAHALEMEVVAEGVETAAALALLQVMGCDMVQGYFLSRPLPLSDLIAFAGKAAAGTAMPRRVSLRQRMAERRISGERG